MNHISRQPSNPLAAIVGLLVIGGFAVWLMSGQQGPPAPRPAEPVSQVLQSPPPGMLWVSAQRLLRYTCPATDCGIVGNFYYREGVEPLETRDGWIRVSRYYDASCVNGRSEYVDTGDADCVRDNGIVDGQFAEWVEKSSLTSTQPADPAAGATGLAKLIAGSDDFNLYETQFVEAARSLLSRGSCTEQEMAEFGGFWESINLRPRKAYFIQCGQEKFYVDLVTMEIFQR